MFKRFVHCFISYIQLPVGIVTNIGRAVTKYSVGDRVGVGCFVDSCSLQSRSWIIIDSTNVQAMQAAACEFDFILNTVAASHDFTCYVNLLKTDGRMVIIGLPSEALLLNLAPLVLKRRSISGSVIGFIKETQEILDFCGRHNITCDIELISGDQVNDAWDRTIAGDV